MLTVRRHVYTASKARDTRLGETQKARRSDASIRFVSLTTRGGVLAGTFNSSYAL
jgi:hypothetical protein